MAVIQISRIQQRRGQKLATGIPQLSSAELAWAVDTQELLIGNGTISEGAPYIGNTRILTEHSNIFENAVYTFMSKNIDITESKERKLLEKLDEYVSVLDYVVIDDSANILWAETFESAITDLYASTHIYRKVLTIPTGTYTFLRNWSLQSGVILRGENQANTILSMGDFTINADSSTDVQLQNFTVTGTDTVFDLTGLTNSSLSDILITGNYTTAVPVNWDTPAVKWINVTNSNKLDNVQFIGCRFEIVNTAISITQTEVLETNVRFKNCVFSNCYRGISATGVTGQANNWTIDNCVFSDIYNSAFIATHGKNTLIRDSSFFRCGNGFGAISNPMTSIVIFGDVANNLVIDYNCDRRNATSQVVTLMSDEIPDITNSNNASLVDFTGLEIIENNVSETAFATFNTSTDYIMIDYGIVMGDYIRTGKLEITVGDILTDPTLIEVTDDYAYTTQIYNVTGPDLVLQLDFNARPSPTSKSVILTYTNGSGHKAELVYKVAVGSMQT